MPLRARFAFAPVRHPARLVARRRRADQRDPARRGQRGGHAPAVHAVAPRARAAALRLARAPQHRRVAGAQPHAREPAPREPRPRRPAAGRDAVGALPHLQVGLRPAPEVVDDRLARLAPQVLDPVRIEAVVGDAVDVDVVDALAAALLLDRDLPVERLERVADRVRAVAGRALGAEAVHVRAPPDALVEARVAHREPLAPLRHEVLRRARVGRDEAAEPVDPRDRVRRAPGVARDQRRSSAPPRRCSAAPGGRGR